MNDVKPQATVKFTNPELRLIIEWCNQLLDAGFFELVNDRGQVVDTRGMLKRVLVAALKSGASQLPSCFTGDQELMDAAAEAKAVREFDINEEPIPDTVH